MLINPLPTIYLKTRYVARTPVLVIRVPLISIEAGGVGRPIGRSCGGAVYLAAVLYDLSYIPSWKVILEAFRSASRLHH